MARKRSRNTLDLLEEALDRLGQRIAFPVERVRDRLGLPETDGWFEDADLLRTVREMRGEAAFARDGAAALRRSIPALSSAPRPDGGLDWFLRVPLPLAEAGRLDLRLKVPASPPMKAVIDRMAGRNDPSHGLQALKDACQASAAETLAGLRAPLARLRADVAKDVRDLGADAPSYVEHLAQALRSQEIAPGANPAQALNDRLKGPAVPIR